MEKRNIPNLEYPHSLRIPDVDQKLTSFYIFSAVLHFFLIRFLSLDILIYKMISVPLIILREIISIYKVMVISEVKLVKYKAGDLFIHLFHFIVLAKIRAATFFFFHCFCRNLIRPFACE